MCDPREEYAEGFDVAGATLVRTMPDDTVVAMAPDGHLAVVAVTHDPKLDDLALMDGYVRAWIGALTDTPLVTVDAAAEGWCTAEAVAGLLASPLVRGVLAA